MIMIIGGNSEPSQSAKSAKPISKARKLSTVMVIELSRDAYPNIAQMPVGRRLIESARHPLQNQSRLTNRNVKTPKYYLTQSFNYNGWWAVCQSSNNVIVAEIPSYIIAVLVRDHLNSLSWSDLGGKQKTK